MDDSSHFFQIAPDMSCPETISPTRIDKGREGHCELWKGVRNGKFRVYKCLRKEFAGNPMYEGLLKKEFELGYGLSHPGICETYGFMDIPGKGHAIEMEWIDGQTLDEFLKQKKPGRKEKIRIFSQLCDVLSYLHSHQIVHRDIKPSNILVTHDGWNVKVIDFGLADSGSWAILKQAGGTERYASPELVLGDKVDCRTDIYSLGMLLATAGISGGRMRRTAVKCIRRDPERRFQNAAEAKASLTKAFPWKIPVAAALLIAAGFLALLQPWRRGGAAANSTPPPGTHEQVKTDTVFVVHEAATGTTRASASPEHATPDAGIPDNAAPDTAALDEIVKMATDLFKEEK